MSFRINLDSHDNMTCAEIFTEPLRGILGGRDHTSGQDKAIYELVIERIFFGIVLFTVGLPYTFVATLVLVVPPVWRAIAACCCRGANGNPQPEEQEPISPDNPPISNLYVLPDYRAPDGYIPPDNLLEQKKVEAREVVQKVQTLMAETELKMKNTQKEKQPEETSDDDSTLTHSSESLVDGHVEVRNSQNLKRVQATPQYIEEREYTKEDVRAVEILKDITEISSLTEQHLKTISLVCDDFEATFQPVQCNTVMSVREFISHRKAIIDNLQHPTIIQIGSTLSLVFPVLNGENSDKMNQSSAIFLNFWEGRQPDIQLFWSVKQGAVCATEAELPLNGNLDYKTIETLKTLLRGHVVGIGELEYKLKPSML